MGVWKYQGSPLSPAQLRPDTPRFDTGLGIITQGIINPSYDILELFREGDKMKFKRHEGGYSYISEDGKWIIMSTGNGGQLAWSVRTTENPHYSLWYSATIAGCKDLIDSHN
jgi:hypothetical protein